jgi:hypothetical protein
VVSDRDILRHLLMQPNDRLNKRHARYVRDLQPFTGAITLTYRKGSMSEADPLSRRADFYGQPNRPMFRDGNVTQTVNIRVGNG